LNSFSHSHSKITNPGGVEEKNMELVTIPP
jgi:hypothetical protein